ncbi:MAG: hypothetical protein JXA11_05355 [Phycisphaerae bacterium]|nr:hypothetical protein [Phycisphaerae bacterium]
MILGRHKSKRAWRIDLLLLGAVFFSILVLGGCRAHPVSLASLIAGDAVNDADVKDRREKLMGRKEAAADEMFGRRLETLVDVDRPDVKIIFYPVKLDLFKKSRYIVELEDGVIVVFSKTKQNIDGVEDMIHDANLERKLKGKTPAQCSRDGELGQPLRTLRSKEKGQLLRIYDIRHWSDFLGARYCVLRFDQNDRCEDITLLGVSATTKKDPIRREEDE